MRLALRNRLHTDQVVAEIGQAVVGTGRVVDLVVVAHSPGRVVDLVAVAHSLVRMERLAVGSLMAGHSPDLAAPGCSLAARKAAEKVHLVADMGNLTLRQITLRLIWRSSLDSRDCWYGPGGP